MFNISIELFTITTKRLYYFIVNRFFMSLFLFNLLPIINYFCLNGNSQGT